ncbi:right-handed parallel beta-helix repeat-containing protein [Nitrosomonas sp.]|uniref:right-handed parallel beta-helix repeat-containing protein n=1 Tax=Nitrosomonas sp. TaxID=42353 RepID=UPI0025E13396|nr:right-handed parallel beta-helix repeat-containing protein [Nitrosomonas sp.]
MKKISSIVFAALLAMSTTFALATVPTIGPKAYTPTSTSGTVYYVATSGSGTTCSISVPCTMPTVIGKVAPGDKVFLRDGIYSLTSTVNIYASGSSGSPIIFESYLGEQAIFDGSSNAKGDAVRIQITGDWVKLRNITIRNMPQQGLWIQGNDNVIDAVTVYDNYLSGILVHHSYSTPYTKSSRNSIINSVIFGNVDEGYTTEGANGGNADGISISSGNDNIVKWNYVAKNSDDGIDAWRSIGTLIQFNLVLFNGLLDGNGNGIKAGGDSPSADNIVKNNISVGNRETGIDCNGGDNITIGNNTTWSNKKSYILCSDSIVTDNIELEYNHAGTGSTNTGNSWNAGGTVLMDYWDVSNKLFLTPSSQTFQAIGARATY